MSAFGNLFSAESNSKYEQYQYTGSFNVADTGNTSVSSPSTWENVGNSTISIGQASELAKTIPYFALGAIVALILYALKE